MTKISRDERRFVIESFYDKISEGAKVDPEWKRKMIDASVPELPDEPTPQQIDAWIELSEIVKDPSHAREVQAGVARGPRPRRTCRTIR